jgi:hypothetical protein
MPRSCRHLTLACVGGKQIWFQNRRQNDRRKSRPLSPQEVAALRYGGMQILSSDPIMYGGHSGLAADQHNDETHASAAHAVHTSPASAVPRAHSPVPSDSGSVTSSEKGDKHDDSPAAASERRDAVHASDPVETATPLHKRSEPHDGSSGLVHSFSSSVGYLANRWNSGSSFSTPSSFGPRGDDSFKYIISNFPFSLLFPSFSILFLTILFLTSLLLPCPHLFSMLT